MIDMVKMALEVDGVPYEFEVPRPFVEEFNRQVSTSQQAQRALLAIKRTVEHCDGLLKAIWEPEVASGSG